MRVRKQMSVFNVTKTLYNVDIYPRHPSILTEGEANDRGRKSIGFLEKVDKV